MDNASVVNPSRSNPSRLSYVVLGAFAAAVVIALGARSNYFVGSAFSLARFPLLAAAGWLVWRHARSRHRFATIVSVTMLLALGGEWTWIRAARAKPGTAAGEERLSVVSYNLLFKGGDPKRTLAVLRNSGADVLALQEVTPVWEAKLKEAFSEKYPYQDFRSHRGTHGLALLSRHPLGEVSVLEMRPGVPLAECAEVRVDASRVYLCNVHLSSPAGAVETRSVSKLAENATRRQGEWLKLSAFVAENATVPARMIAGDLNTMETDPLYRDIRAGWVDVFRAERSALGATWPNLHKKTTALFRIDYVLLEGPLEPAGASVLSGGGSDHLPVKAEIRL